MITGLKVHTDRGAIHVVDAPEDYNTGEFLGDLVKQIHPGSARHNWTLRNGIAGEALLLNLSLGQNHVQSNQELYLAPKPQDVDLEVSAPNGKTLQCEVSSSTRTSDFLATLILHFDLPKTDSKGRLYEWILVQEVTKEALDSNQSLAANGVAGHDRLSLQPRPVQPIKFVVISPTGSVRQDDAPPDTPTSELLSGLVEYFVLPAKDDEEAVIQYLLRLKESGKTLDVSKTLAENGVAQNDQLLLLAAEMPSPVLEVGVSDGATLQVAIPGTTLTETLLSANPWVAEDRFDQLERHSSHAGQHQHAFVHLGRSDSSHRAR